MSASTVDLEPVSPLAGIPKLEALADVVNGEQQMLTERVRRQISVLGVVAELKGGGSCEEEREGVWPSASVSRWS